MPKKVVIIISLVLIIAIIGWFGFQKFTNHPMTVKEVPKKSEVQEPKYSEAIKLKYEAAVQKFLKEDYPESKKICLDLLANNPQARVSYGGSSSLNFKIGPALLDILGRIYTQENDTENAMKCYQRMIDQFPNDSYPGPFEGESYYDGTSGAEGLLNQIDIHVTNQDYETAYQLNRRLNQKYALKIKGLCEAAATYGWLSADKLEWILDQSEAPLEKRTQEYRKLIDISKDPVASSLLLLDLARRYSKENDFAKAEVFYNELITRYPYDYDGSEVEGYDFLSLRACTELISIYQQQDGLQEKIEQVKMKLREIAQKISTQFQQENGYNPFGSDSPYSEYLNE